MATDADNPNEPSPLPRSSFRPDVLAGQVALVTGGGTGIGKEIARMLGAHGASVAIISRKREVLEATAEELRAEGITVHVDDCDIRDAEAVQRVVDGVVEQLGRLDIVVNNAAGNFPAPLAKISPKGFKTVVDIDLIGTYTVSRAAFDAWLSTHGGVITNISAPYELKGIAFQGHAAAAKAGVDSLTRTAAVEWGPYGVRVNAVAPGVIGGTEGVRIFADTPVRRSGRRNPLGMVGHGGDIAAMALFLATPAARFISGQVIAVDGAGSTDLFKLPLPEPGDSSGQ